MPNPGFEERTDCIFNDNSIFDAYPWFSPTDATPDLFHECAIVLEEPCPYPETPESWLFGVPTNFNGCQEPNNGLGYAGAFFAYDNGFVEWVEYLGTRLLQPLQEDSVYHVEFYVSMAEVATDGTWMICAGFDSDSLDYSKGFIPGYSTTIEVDDYVTLTPNTFITDREGWVKVEFTYIADGTEQFLYIGNLFPFGDTEFEQVVFPGDTVGVQFPLQYWGAAYYYIDDVYVGIQKPSNHLEQLNTISLTLYPNPAINNLTVNSVQNGEITIYASNGQVVKVVQKEVQERSIDVSNLNNGVYIVRFTSGHHTSTRKLIVSKALSP